VDQAQDRAARSKALAASVEIVLAAGDVPPPEQQLPDWAVGGVGADDRQAIPLPP
jgi:hypothetical protein